jgi:hypothetical protein
MDSAAPGKRPPPDRIEAVRAYWTEAAIGADMGERT